MWASTRSTVELGPWRCAAPRRTRHAQIAGTGPGGTGTRAGLVADWYVTVSGDSPQRLLNNQAGRGEAVRSKQAAKRRGGELDWTIQGREMDPD